MKKKNLPPTLPIPQVTTLPAPNRLNPTSLPPSPPTQRLNQIKYQKLLVFKTFSTSCHFLL